MKNATLRQLAVFETVARHLHFTRAAEELGTTQPSVSIQVKQLEDNLDIPLFEQLGKRIFLTEAGQELHRYCRHINQHLADAQTVLDRLRGTQGGCLKLCIGHTAKYFVPQLLAALRRQHGEVFIQLEVARRQRLLSLLADNTCDMAIMGAPPEDQDLVAEPFMEDPLVFIAAPDHPLAQERSISLSRLVQEPFLMRESDSDTRNTMEQLFAKTGLTISPSMVVNSNEALKRSVQAELGLAMVPLHSVMLEVAGRHLVVLDIDAIPLRRSWYVVHRQGKRFSRVAEAFKNLVLQTPQQQIQDNVKHERVRAGSRAK